MIIGEDIICDFVWYAGTHLPTPTATPRVIDLELTNIDAIYHMDTQYGVANVTNIIINHHSYTIRYKRTWPDWTSTNREIRMKGIVTATLKGDEDMFMQHLMVLRLS